MTSVFAPENYISLTILRPQDSSDQELLKTLGADQAIAASGNLEGEFVKAETVASSELGGGRRCLDLRTVMVTHHPGLLAARVMLDVVSAAADGYIRQAGTPASETFAKTSSLLEQEVGPAELTALASDTLAAIDRIADETIRNIDVDGDASGLVQSVQDANVAPAAADAVAPELQRLRVALQKRMRDRDTCNRDGWPDRAHAVTRAATTWSAVRGTAFERIERRQQDESDTCLARANEIAADMPVADTGGNGAPLTMFKARLWSFLFTESSAAPAGQQTPTGDLRASLRAYLRARLIAAAANQMRLALAAVSASLQADAQHVDRLRDLVTKLVARAKDTATTLDEQCEERMRRATGWFVPARPEIRTALARDILATAGETLVNLVIRAPLISCQRVEDALQYECFENGALDAARALTAGLRDDSLAQLVGRLGPAEVDALACVLASPEPTLRFRPGHRAPEVYRRIAVPDGPDGVLGLAIRRRFTGIDVVRSVDPLLAFGVAVTDVFSVDQLEAYHGRWGQAREAARHAGTDRRLVSDRRLLEVEDGLTTNQELDTFIVRGVVSGSIASSKEPPAVERAHGTWYLMPPEQLVRPSSIDPARLDTIFNGYRLGRSLVEIRTTLRHTPRHRQVIDERWQAWCNEHSLEQRAMQIDLVMQNMLPSDELSAACRDVKSTLTRELRLRIQV